MSVPSVSLEVFYSYAHEDEVLRNELEKHLSILHWQELISSWHDRKIAAGADWAKDIDTHLETASLILLLVSSDFLASGYCYGIEMKRALERHWAKEACVIPILLRPVVWKGAPFEHLQVLPTDGRPVTSWPNQDLAFYHIAWQIRKRVKALQTTKMNHLVSPQHLTSREKPSLLRSRQASEEGQPGGVMQRKDFPSSLAQVHHYQRKVGELKNVHNALHEIEVQLEGLSATIQLAVRRKREQGASRKWFPFLKEESKQSLPDFNYVEIAWRHVVRKMGELIDFATEEMEVLEDERFSCEHDVIRGAPWVKDLFILQLSFEKGARTRNRETLENLSNELLITCRSHLYRIDKRLLGAIKELDLASDDMRREWT